MKVGMNLLYWTTELTPEHDAVLESLAELGYDGVEVPVFSGQPEHYQRLARKLDELKLQRTCVYCITDPKMNLVSEDATVRRAGQRDMERALACTQALGASTMIGPLTQTLGVFTRQPPTDVERQRVVESLRALAPQAQAAGVLLAIEPINRFECYMANTLDQAAQIAREVAHPHVAAMLDTHHGHIEEKSQIEAIRRNRDVFRHIHFSENDRGTPGSGQIDFKGIAQVLREIDYDGWVVVEAFSRKIPWFAAAVSIWREMSDDPDRLPADALKYIRSL
jgi:D-psicose/D-tagatose/L-ribulose 3-epimerase